MRALLLVSAILAATTAAVHDVHAQNTALARGAGDAPAWNAAALADVLGYVQSQRSTGLLIIQRGHVVAGANWPLGSGATAFRNNFVHGTAGDGALLEDVASQQKSFVAVLVGAAIDKGLLDISRPVAAYAGAGWSKASAGQETRISVRNLLQMNSGLREDLTYEMPPDTRFFYNTPAYAVLKSVLEGASRQSLDELTRLWLTEPLGMSDTSWRKRPDSMRDAGNPTGLVTTPRDIAKMGQLVLDGGRAANGKRVISKAQLDAMLRPTATNPSYGQLWWLNGGSWSVSATSESRRTEGRLVPAAPADMVAAMGAQDRKLFVVPGLGLIVVRTGQAAPDRDFNQQLWVRLMKALPAS